MNDFSALGGSIDQISRASVSEALANLAALKNVPLTADEGEEAAGLLFTQMDWPQVCQLTGLDGIAACGWAVNGHLDMIAVARLKGIIRDIEGKEDINDPVVTAVTLEIVNKLDAGLASRECVHWPNLWVLVMNHYAGKPRGPTVGVREDGTVCTRWWLGLDFHRDPKEGPANIEEKGAHRLEEYYVKCQRHRPPEDGPAEVIVDSVGGKARRVEAYWVDGKRHRPHAEGPAVICTHYKDNLDVSGVEYFENGKEHRPVSLGPAIVNWDRTGRKVLELFMEDGDLHREPKDGPASFVIRDPITVKGTADNVTVLRYCVRGQNHRDEKDGPAATCQDNTSGVLLQEEYWRNGVLHRDHGPARIERATDGSVSGESWYRDGKLHREAGEGPASVWRYPDLVCEQWFVNGKEHRDPAEGPAVITHDLMSGTVREEFWVEGNRWSAEGPASVKRDRDGKMIEELFWDGKQLPPQRPDAPRMEVIIHG